MLDSMKGSYAFMSSWTPFFIFFVLLLSFTERLINSESFVPPSAHVFSGSSDFHLNQRNRSLGFTHNMNQISKMTSDDSTLPPSFQKSPSLSYENLDELTSNFYNAARTVNINELLKKKAIFRFFQDDNFDENYQRINETYFLQGIGVEEGNPPKPYIQSSSTVESLPTIIAVNTVSPQFLPPSSTLLSMVSTPSPPLNTSTAIILDDFEITTSIAINLNTDSNITSNTRSNRILLDNDNKNEEHELSNTNSTTQKKDSKIAIAPLSLKYWEMQRTDSGQSIIKVATVSTPTRVIKKNDLYHVSITENGNMLNDDNSGSNDSNSNGNQRDITTLKENPSFPSSTNQSAISVNNILTRNTPTSEDNLITTTATVETIFTTSSELFSTILIPKQDQKIQSTEGKIGFIEDITNFGAEETTSAKFSTMMETVDAEDLTLSTKEINFFPENSSSSPEIDLSSFSVLHLKTSPLPSPLPPPSFSLSSATPMTATVDNNGLMESSSTNKFLSNDDEGKIHSKFENDGKSEITNSSSNFDRNEMNLDLILSQNVGFEKLNRKKIENSLTYSSNEQWQAKNEFTDITSTTPLPRSNSNSGRFDLSSGLGNQIDDAFNNLIHLEKQQMGISIPKYKNSLTELIVAQIPKNNGINTVMIDTAENAIDTDISIKREITRGKILEEQKTFINGKPVILELWNPVIYGHDWLANPGAIIHGSIQPLQAKIYNIESQFKKRRNRYQHIKMFDVRSILNGTRMNQKSKEEEKPEKAKSITMKEMDRKEKLVKACYSDSKGFNDNSNDQESNILVIYTEKENSSTENKLQGIGKYQQHLQQCFYVMNNCALSATAPFERRIGISLIECAQFCSSLPGCLSASYSIRFSICDVYHFKFDLRGKKVSKMEWHYYLEPQIDNTSKCLIENPSKQIRVRKTIRNGKKPIIIKQEMDKIGTNLNISSVHHDILLNYSKNEQQYNCPNGENIVMMKMHGWRISKFNGRKRKYFTTEIDCLQSCIRNVYKKNTAYYCSAATFDENSNRCTLYSIIHQTNSPLIRGDTSTIYYGKHCFSEQISELCNGALIEHQPQHVLITFPDAILTTPTLTKCLLKCLWSIQDGQIFQCHSIMYFYEQKIDNCILNSRSKKSNPNSLKEETISVVDYFGLDDCLNIPLMEQTSKTNPIRIHQYKKHQNILISRKMHNKW